MSIPIRTLVRRLFGFAFLAHVALTLFVFAHEFPGPEPGPLAPTAAAIRQAYAWIGRGDMTGGMLIAALVLVIPLLLTLPQARRH